MKDLFVLTADSDAQALMRALLHRHRDLKTHPISSKVERFTGRDSGMVKDGPEVARWMVQKTEYSRLILVWDHHGSGWHSRPPAQALTKMQQRLDGVTWADRSAAVVLVRELEEWLWHCPATVARWLGSTTAELETATTRVATKLNLSRERCCREKPKELFEEILYHKERRKPLPEDFEMLGSHANLANWTASETFGRLLAILRAWFPAK